MSTDVYSTCAFVKKNLLPQKSHISAFPNSSQNLTIFSELGLISKKNVFSTQYLPDFLGHAAMFIIAKV